MPRLPLPPAESIKLVALAEIARGGMGSVELARAEGGRLDGQLLAIKRLHPNIALDPQFVGMFLDEAWMTAALDSPNVVKVAAWGNDAKGMYLAVEFVKGVSLSRLLKEAAQNREPFAERTVAFIASQICGGLSAAHALKGEDGAFLGLVHRDLTPGNILLSFEGVLKIVDFGIAKAEERITHTRSGTLKGKPAYMAPEQSRGAKVDSRADIFSLGVVMFEMLTGRRPWTSKSAFDLMLEVAEKPPPELVSLRPSVNSEFIEIVKTCLEKKATDRFQSAAQIKNRLDTWRKAKNFDSDDKQSLASFVMRNSTAQIRWFDEALRGEMRRGEKPTFKELEEKIDAERESQRGARIVPPIRPAAGAPASAGMIEAQPARTPRAAGHDGAYGEQRKSGAGRIVLPAEPGDMPTIVNPGMRESGAPEPEPRHNGTEPTRRGLGGTHFLAATPMHDGVGRAAPSIHDGVGRAAPSIHDGVGRAAPSIHDGVGRAAPSIATGAQADPNLRTPNHDLVRGPSPALSFKELASRTLPSRIDPKETARGSASPPNSETMHANLPATGGRASDVPLPSSPTGADARRSNLAMLASTAPMDPSALQRRPSANPYVGLPSNRASRMLEATVNDPLAGAPRRKKANTTPVFVFAALLVMGGSAIAAWKLRDRILPHHAPLISPPASSAPEGAP